MVAIMVKVGKFGTYTEKNYADSTKILFWGLHNVKKGCMQKKCTPTYFKNPFSGLWGNIFLPYVPK